jgi:metal-responsive CopG/Arc/MetJ family transcriptional regulator
MKTGISIPDELFNQAQTFADRLGISRSEIYQRAIAAYLAQNAHDGVTDRLNQIYQEDQAELDPLSGRLQFSSLSTEEW